VETCCSEGTDDPPRLDAEDADDPLQIVGQNVQAHLSRHGLERSCQKVSGPIQRLSVPKTCSTVHLRICMASCLCRSRSSMVSWLWLIPTGLRFLRVSRATDLPAGSRTEAAWELQWRNTRATRATRANDAHPARVTRVPR
jgi:hypothetical protein